MLAMVHPWQELALGRSIRPRLRRAPFNGIVAVKNIIAKMCRFSLRRITSARILDDNSISLAGCTHDVEQQCGDEVEVLVIGGS
jgi:hypothetical protein